VGAVGVELGVEHFVRVAAQNQAAVFRLAVPYPNERIRAARNQPASISAEGHRHDGLLVAGERADLTTPVSDSQSPTWFPAQGPASSRPSGQLQ